MKEAWLCYEVDENFVSGYDSNRAIIFFEEPTSKWKYAKIVRIVYTEIIGD